MIPRNFPFKIYGSPELFDVYASVDIAALSNANVITFTIDRPGTSWLTFFGHGIDVLSAFETSVWKILINGVPIRHYANIQDQLALFNDPRQIVPTRCKQNDVISVYAQNDHATDTYKYGARIWGFHDTRAPYEQ